MKKLWNDEQQERFIGRLRESSRAVFAVALHQHLRSRLVEIPPVTFSPRADTNTGHTDDGDLFVTIANKRCRFEIKHRKRHFTSATDWPDSHLFIANKGAIDRANGEVAFYVIVNNDITHAAVVRGTTQKFWYEVEKFAPNAEQKETVYCCPLNLVEFIKLNAAP